MAFVLRYDFLIMEQDLNENYQIFVNLNIFVKQKNLFIPVKKYNSSINHNHKATFCKSKKKFNLFIYRVAYLSYKETVAVGEAKKMDL